VTQIANSAKNIGSALEQVTNFEVRVFILPESYADLITPEFATPFRPGMSASVSIHTETRSNVLAIPFKASSHGRNCYRTVSDYNWDRTNWQSKYLSWKKAILFVPNE